MRTKIEGRIAACRRAAGMTYNGVEEHGLVKGCHEGIDWILVVRVVEFFSGDSFNFVAKVAVLFRVRDPRRHGQQCLLYINK